MNCVNALQFLNICKILSSFLFQTAAALGISLYNSFPLTFVSPDTCASSCKRRGREAMFTSITS